MTDLLAHTLNVPLKPDGFQVYDVGAGIRPYTKLGKPICVEPSDVYAEVLKDHGYSVILATAYEALHALDKNSTVLLLDVLEHMEQSIGLEVITMMEEFDRAVIYTPRGFLPQDTDEWGLEQHSWQKHRSGWLEDHFPNWHVTKRKTGQTEALFCIRS